MRKHVSEQVHGIPADAGGIRQRSRFTNANVLYLFLVCEVPAPYHKLKPKDRYTLRQAAGVGNMLQVSCLACMRPAQVFLASDLLQLLGPDADAKAPPFECRRCGTMEFVQVKLRTPFTLRSA